MTTLRQENKAVWVLNHRGRDVAVMTESEMVEVAEEFYVHARRTISRRLAPNRKIIYIEGMDEAA